MAAMPRAVAQGCQIAAKNAGGAVSAPSTRCQTPCLNEDGKGTSRLAAFNRSSNLESFMRDRVGLHLQQVLTGQGLSLAQHEAQSEQVSVVFGLGKFPLARARLPSDAAAKRAVLIFRSLVFIVLVVWLAWELP